MPTAINNQPLVQHILTRDFSGPFAPNSTGTGTGSGDITTTTTSSPPAATRQHAIASTPVLVRALPPSSYLDKLGQQASKRAKRQHILTESLESALETPIDAFAIPLPDKDHPQHALGDDSEGLAKQNKMKGKVAKRYESWELLKAIEKKQLMTIYDIKSNQFELLLEPVGGSTPLVHAMRHGPSHQEVAILITGALSKQVNELADLPPESFSRNDATKALLRGIRGNLKLAITQGLISEHTSLLASFLQVIVMSEGEKWLQKAGHEVALACRAGPPGRAVAAATTLIDKWVSRELQKTQIAAVGEYVFNSIGDLVLLGLWSIVMDILPKEEMMPLYFFARDDRMTKWVQRNGHAAMEERVEALKRNGGWTRLSPLLRKQINGSLAELSKRTIGGRERVAGLKKLLDE
ncbi:BQ5605_C019g08918 [Microbotryum silenes-dioicae]|uniref:BQ5605_C019g08918 protein n=1 Tax=Microbotryum silenes-dioicae TaxID=796604 RepID=A0A2X0NTX6_9BASI|nr:BQ5605_C019g08918 [Microbotryum silenes-dioicae]